MQVVFDYIENHLDDSLSIEILSQEANFSPFHFHRQFRAFTGYPVYKMIQLLRLKRASKELAFSTAKSITDIAYDAGFGNAESFSRAFKNVLQQTPSTFRTNPD